MTGLRPDNLGVWTLPIHFRESVPTAITLPQWFRRFGYTAVGHGKIFHNPTPDPQSWSEPIRPLSALASPYPEGTRAEITRVNRLLTDNDWRKDNLRGPSTASPDVEDNELLDGAQTDMAIDDLRRLGREDAPFFLAMGYIRPHLAWISPKKYWDLHDPAELPVLADQQVTPNTPAYALSNSSELTHYVDLVDFPEPTDEKRISEETARHLMHAYYAAVSYIDAQIGRLLDALEEEGLAENTIIVLWSDHGWKLGEFNGWGKMSNYEIDARVPLIISAPGLEAAGKQSSELAQLLDLFPTLCELAGIDIPEFVDGRSLVPNLLDTSTRVNQAAFNQYYRKHENREYMGYAMRTDAYRFVEWRDFKTGEVAARELYDHRSDHTESQNLADSAPSELLNALTAQLLATNPRIGLNMTPSIHSIPSPSRARTSVSFVNSIDTELMIYPITTAGRRGRVKLLKPARKLTLNSGVGDVYVIESRDGTIHQIHSAALKPREVMITRGRGIIEGSEAEEPIN